METFLIDTGREWFDNMRWDTQRYVIFAVGVWLTLWVLLAPVLKGRKIRADRPPLRQLALEFFFSIRSVAVFSTVALSMFLLERAGMWPGPEIAAGWGPVWFWICLILMIIGHDAFFYWSHRLMHDPRLFRRFHRRHHKSGNPSPFTAYSFDLGEAAIMAAFVPLWSLIVPTPWGVSGLFMLHQIVRNTLGHSGYELMPSRKDGRPMVDFLTTTTHHDLHHAQAGWNYGLYFTWWDRWMGTEHPDYHARFAAAVRKPLAQALTSAHAPAAIGVLAALAVAGLAAAPLPAHAQSAATLSGDWATPGLGAVVRFEPCAQNAGRTCGRLIWAWDPAEIRHVSIGGVMIEDLAFRDGAWRGGRLTDPENGRQYSGDIRREGDVLRLRGCAGPFCQSQTWRRLASIPRP